jgi:hypothetical protein
LSASVPPTLLARADEVIDDIYLVDSIIRKFHSRKLIFNLNHQFQAVEPVRSAESRGTSICRRSAELRAGQRM